jgi:hypothetical protein
MPQVQSEPLLFFAALAFNSGVIFLQLLAKAPPFRRPSPGIISQHNNNAQEQNGLLRPEFLTISKQAPVP